MPKKTAAELLLINCASFVRYEATGDVDMEFQRRLIVGLETQVVAGE